MVNHDISGSLLGLANFSRLSAYGHPQACRIIFWT
jgi:hypothetical protein